MAVLISAGRQRRLREVLVAFAPRIVEALGVACIVAGVYLVLGVGAALLVAGITLVAIAYASGVAE